MGLTLSHTSALHLVRDLRCKGEDLRAMSHVGLARPSTWIGKRWSMREFASDEWRWIQPSSARPLHILVGKKQHRVRMKNIRCHLSLVDLPAHAIIWLDEHTCISGPELLFVQMAESMSVPELVLLGNELCGNFSQSAESQITRAVTDNICTATTQHELRQFIRSLGYVPGIVNARKAVEYVADHALSMPEAILALMYSLPAEEAGYDMGPVELNQRVYVEGGPNEVVSRSRYPDLMFAFAPVGINYDGEGHLDLPGLVRTAQQAALASGEDRLRTAGELRAKTEEVRAKVVDDIRRNRQLAASGRIVMPATKEDMRDIEALDTLTSEVLSCACKVFGLDTHMYEQTLQDTERKRERRALLSSLSHFC